MPDESKREIERRPWRCPNGHILGASVRNGNHVRGLVLFRNAIEHDYIYNLIFSNDTQATENVIARIEGTAIDVHCSVCGSVRTWVPGQEYIDGLISKHEKMEIC